MLTSQADQAEGTRAGVRRVRHRARGGSARAAVLLRVARSRVRGHDGVPRAIGGARADVRHVLPSARTVIVTATNYNTDRPYSTECTDPTRAHVARYAWGDDYHDVILARLDALLAWMREVSREPFEARAYVDTGPVQERVYAQHAGIGWIGKNTCVINPRARLLDVPRRNHLQPAARGRCARLRPVRHLHAVSRSVSDAGAGGARRARFDAVHLVSDDRAPRRDRGAASRRESARTCTAATSARKSAPGTPSRRPPAIPRGSRVPCGIGLPFKRSPR